MTTLTKPLWHRRATRAELREIEAIDQLIAHLRERRQTLIGRMAPRTAVWTRRNTR